MPNTVTLTNTTQFSATQDQTILDSAIKAGIALEHSCKTGRCGVCKVQVLSGDTTPLKTEESLSDTEMQQGYILTCCRAAVTDVELDTEDLGELGSIQSKTLPCRIDSLQLLADDVIEVVLRTPPSAQLDYLPGQYADIIGKDGLRRSYSIANAPKSDGKISLHIRKVENGQMSDYWFNYAQPNDLLRMEAPLGTFCLRNKSAEHLVLLATGTGIAPIKAMLEQLVAQPEKNTYSQIHLYWGGRTEKDIYWQPDFPGLRLNFVPVLSRTPEWPGRKGHVQQCVLADSIPLANAVVYVCGSDIMIQSASQQLIAAGLDKKNFYSDAFVSSN